MSSTPYIARCGYCKLEFHGYVEVNKKEVDERQRQHWKICEERQMKLYGHLLKPKKQKPQTTIKICTHCGRDFKGWGYQCSAHCRKSFKHRWHTSNVDEVRQIMRQRRYIQEDYAYFQQTGRRWAYVDGKLKPRFMPTPRRTR